MQQPSACRGPIDRREFLRAGVLSVGGLTLADVCRARAAAGRQSDTAVILLYLNGGASHLETYDLKPDAPSEYRSIYEPIATNVPGIDICERFPLQARLADKFTLIRSVHHAMTAHSDGGIEVLTGKTPLRPDPSSTSVGEHPEFGAFVSRARAVHPRALPAYVAVPQRLYMVRPSYLGAQHGPFTVMDPSSLNYRPPGLTLPTGVNAERLDDRRFLRGRFDAMRRELDHSGQLEGMDEFSRLAFQMLASSDAAQAFDLGLENDRLRDRYGRNVWGQSCLLARRLAEAGTAVISINLNTPFVGPEYTNWDDHILNANRPGHFGTYMDRRLPYLDQALGTLIDDVSTRGLDERIMVLVLSEFGRTPRLSRNINGVGRDHWPDAMSVLISGGGLRMGQVIGATNSRGEFPSQRPLTPQDVLATAYRHLGVDARQSFLDHSGRPMPVLSEGTPIAELG